MDEGMPFFHSKRGHTIEDTGLDRFRKIALELADRRKLMDEVRKL